MKYGRQNRDSANTIAISGFGRDHKALSTMRRALCRKHLVTLMSRCAASMIALLLSLPVAAQAEPLQLQVPVQPACVLSPFGWRRTIGPNAPAGFHNGIDLPAPAGGMVRAAAAGTISSIRRQGLGGVTIRISHSNDTATLYAHLGNLAPAIAQGRRSVAAGEPLARVARTGVTYGTHLFFAVFVRNVAVDPLTLMDVPPCRTQSRAPQPILD